jgi:cytochrome b involved in lipid metabolism|tara:strand:- start:331 stop:564 length:234 start_codon:yes stop_codon:yes gene_type:complete
MNLYTIEEVKRHNIIKDAWLIYNNNVYDITDYIKLHPGSMSIKKGIGKDATKIINKIGHSKRAIEIMSKYKIGILKE